MPRRLFPFALLSVCAAASCAPLTRTSVRTEPVVRLERRETLALDRGRPRLRATLHGNTLTLDAHDSLLCLVRRTEHTTSTVKTTVEPSKTVIAAEVVLAIVGLTAAGFITFSEPWRDQNPTDETEQPFSALASVALIGIPASIGVGAAIGAGVDGSSYKYSESPESRTTTLPDSYARCTDSALSGHAVTLQYNSLTLRSRFGPDGKAPFPLEPAAPAQLADSPLVEIAIDERLIGRVRLEQAP